MSINKIKVNSLVHDINDARVSINGSRLEIKNDGKTYIASLTELVKPATPVISCTFPNSTIGGSTSFTISCSTSGSTIYYTTNGTDPTTSSTKYSSAVTISPNTSSQSNNVTIKAIAVKNGEISDIGSKSGTLYRKVATPTFTVDGDEYDISRNVTINCTTSSPTIYYTIDGNNPTTNSSTGTSVSIVDSCTVKAMGTKSQWCNSTVGSQAVTVGTKKMYYGVVTNTPTSLLGLTAIKDKTFPQTINVTGTGKVSFTYDSNLGNILSIKDANGTEYITQFILSTNITGYNTYTMKSSANQDGLSYTFKLTK